MQVLQCITTMSDLIDSSNKIKYINEIFLYEITRARKNVFNRVAYVFIIKLITFGIIEHLSFFGTKCSRGERAMFLL